MNSDPSNVIIVLDRPQNVSNIGSVVRAMKNMGFSKLRLVNPKPFEREAVLRVAHRSEDLLDSMRVFTNLDDALADSTYVVGASTRAHAGKPFTNDVATLSSSIRTRSVGAPVALLFGTEADGLDHFALDRCHLVAALPVNPDYPSLNLAQAVLLFLYELRKVVHADPASQAYAQPSTLTPERSTPHGATPRKLSEQPGTPQGELQRLFDMTEEMLNRASFFRYNPVFVMRTVRDLTFRAQPAPNETALLVSIVRRLLYVMNEFGDVDDGDTSSHESAP